MRIVIYDDESFEPITVIRLRGVTHRDIEARGRHWRVTVPQRLNLAVAQCDEAPKYEPIPTVDLEFEMIIRQTSRNGRQEHWLCFTRAADLAMLLNPAWLPGQRPAIDELRDQNDRLVEMMLAHIGR